MREASKKTKLNQTKSDRHRQARDYKKFVREISKPMSIHFNHIIEAKTKQDFEEAYSEMKKKQVFLENPSLKNKISLKKANIRPTSGQSRALQEAKSSGSILDGNQLKYSKKSLME